MTADAVFFLRIKKMAMKQTQTKLYSFEDVGLNFSNEAKTYFPDRFKKMFATGYNTQTVTSVSVAGNQVTFTYGGVHGYAVNRVLKIASGVLASINTGEFVIDSVTTNTVTMTIDGAPTSISGGFPTNIASLGWDLVFEQPFIHVYKIKHTDDTDRYLRLCFTSTATNAAWRNTMAPCIGKTYNPATGDITDALALQANTNIQAPTAAFLWAFSYWARNAANALDYAAGYANTGLSWVVGSPYHLILATGHGGGSEQGRKTSKRFNGFLPTHMMNYESLEYPVLIGESSNPAATTSEYQYDVSRAFVGNVGVTFESNTSNTSILANRPQAFSDFTLQDTFNTTTAGPMLIYEQATKQVLGSIYGGCYIVKHATNNFAVIDFGTVPYITKDIDFSSNIVIHCMTQSNAASTAVFFAMPLERVKND